MRTIVVEVVGLKKIDKRSYTKPGVVEVSYEADVRSVGVDGIGGAFWGQLRFKDAADTPKIGDRFEMALNPVAASVPSDVEAPAETLATA